MRERPRFFPQGTLAAQDERQDMIKRSHVHGWNEAMATAAQHIEAQHAVWDDAGVPIAHIIQYLANNIRSLTKELPPE